MSEQTFIHTGMTLEEAWEKVINHLGSSPENPDSAFRYPSVATKALHGHPVQRTVVLRDVTPGQRLLFFTDRRSHKVRQLRNSPELHILFYDHSLRLQLLMIGKGLLHFDDELSKKHWDQSGSDHPGSYTSVKIPGEILSDPEEAYEYLSPSSQNFCVVEVVPLQMEFLQLRREGHLRSRRTFDGEKEQMYWIAP